MYFHTILTVRDISRDDRARIATCSLRTPTYILKENDSIDVHCSSREIGFRTSFALLYIVVLFSYMKKQHNVNTVEPLLYDHPQNHIGVVV